MSRITLTKKANGRLYLGMSPEDFKWLKYTIDLAHHCPQLRDATADEIAEKEAIARIHAAIAKGAKR